MASGCTCAVRHSLCCTPTGPQLKPYLQIEQLRGVGLCNLGKLEARIQGVADTLEGTEGAQHESEGCREPEGLV